MRYAQAGGYTPEKQAARERLRLEAAERFERGDATGEIARDLRVGERSVRQWRQDWRSGGVAALRSRGPVSVERLSGEQWERLEAELKRGPLAHGFEDDQRWTLKRIKLLIGRMFHVSYTVQGVWKLLRRHGWTCQVPLCRAVERDEAAIEVWKAEVWPAGKAIAADLGAHICFEDEAGQALSPPKGRTWAPRGLRPVVHVRGSRGKGRVNMAGVCCYRPGHRARLFYKLHVYHGRKGEPKSFAWQDYRDLITATHQQLGTPVVWVWDNLNVHLVQELADFAEEHKEWLRVFQMPSYAPELNPQEGVWSLLKRSIANFVAADLTGLTRLVKRKLKQIQYRPELITGCLAETGLTMDATKAPGTATTSSI